MHKSLSKVPGLLVISNCGMPAEKISEFLDHHLQPLMKQGESYIKDNGDFLEKLKRVEQIPKEAILVTADGLGFIQVFHMMEAWKSFENSTIN